MIAPASRRCALGAAHIASAGALLLAGCQTTMLPTVAKVDMPETPVVRPYAQPVPVRANGSIYQASQYRPLFEAAGQQLVVSAESDLPAALLDEARAFQILGNLLSNASRYTPLGGRVDVRLQLAETPDELLVIVRDNGVGIPADEQDRLGDLFFRARTANLVSARGAGLGLFITNSLVQLHGGRLWFESVEGQGTAFYVTFLLANPLER